MATEKLSANQKRTFIYSDAAPKEWVDAIDMVIKAMRPDMDNGMTGNGYAIGSRKLVSTSEGSREWYLTLEGGEVVNAFVPLVVTARQQLQKLQSQRKSATRWDDITRDVQKSSLLQQLKKHMATLISPDDIAQFSAKYTSSEVRLIERHSGTTIDFGRS